VRKSGTQFTIDGREFFVASVKNHYLTFGSQAEVLRSPAAGFSLEKRSGPSVMGAHWSLSFWGDMTPTGVTRRGHHRFLLPLFVLPAAYFA
jgi:hypothetical protein